MKSIFVTVGTTSFDDLISTICLPAVLDNVKDFGYDNIVVQYGRGAKPNVPVQTELDNEICGTFANGLIYNMYRFKSSLEVCFLLLLSFILSSRNT